MLFPTPSFALFFVLVFLGGWAVSSGRMTWRVFMLAVSYYFFAMFGTEFVALFAGITLLGWSTMWATARAGLGTRIAKVVSTIGVAAHLGVLVWYKLYGFLALALHSALDAVGIGVDWEIVQVAIPVGVSFLAFRGIGAIVDVYRGDAPAPSLLNFALFMSFFPYLAAGPVVRMGEVIPQFMAQANPSRLRATEGFMLIAGGLVKKMLIADYLARVIIDDVFAAPQLYGALDTLAGVYGYAVQIYCDFSGYTDMAIGIALLLGISLPQNFDAPYASVSLQQFWRRWHMTLSRFLRDYLYIPLGGNRRGATRTRINLLVTMVLGGLWHGAGLNFIVWGALHGAGLVVESLFRRRGVATESPSRTLTALKWFLTLNFVVLAWVFFRADSAQTAIQVIGRLFTGWGIASTVPSVVWLMIVSAVGIQFVPKTLRTRFREAFWSLRPVVQGSLLALVLFAVAALTPEGPTAFIYAGF